MAEGSDGVQDALAAYLDYLELGGAEPDTSHLTASERAELKSLVDALELTEGVAFGAGDDASATPQTSSAATPEGTRLLGQLREALPPGVRIEADGNASVSQIGGLEVIDGWLVGTFGGRVRVWLLAIETAHEVEESSAGLGDLNRLFRMFPDTDAVALVAKDLSCLIVQPQDTAPQISVPSGSLVSRSYRRGIQPAAEAVATFLDELIPYWDPIPAFDPNAGLRIDAVEVTASFVRSAVERQRGIGERARKGNPKKDALLAFGMKEVSALADLANGLFDGSLDPADIEERIERLARKQ
jgi:hypothetical protein